MEFQSGYERNLETIPVGELGIISLKSCEALGNKIYRARNVAELTLNGKRNGLVLIVYYAHYLRRRHFVDMSAVFVRLFGRKVTVIHNAPPLVIRYFQPQPRHSPP